MTTHQLADLLDTLRNGLVTVLKPEAARTFAEAATAFREMPDHKPRQLAEQLRKVNAPAPAGGNGKKSGGKPVDVPALIERVRAVRAGTAADGLADLDGLNNAQLRAVLSAFGQQPTNTTAGNLTRVKQLLHPAGATNGTGAVPKPDEELVENGVRLYTRLRDTKGITIPEVRANFATIRGYPKAVVEEISRRLNYTPSGSLKEILDRLQVNLEDIKMHQLSAEFVGSGA